MVPVLGDTNRQGLCGCFACSSASSSTARCGMASLRMELGVLGWLTTSSPLIRFTCLLTEMVIFSTSKSIHSRARSYIRFHDLRHTFATLSLKYGVNIKTLSGALGHYDAGFTLSTYTHATEGMKRSAADTIGSVISQTM